MSGGFAWAHLLCGWWLVAMSRSLLAARAPLGLFLETSTRSTFKRTFGTFLDNPLGVTSLSRRNGDEDFLTNIRGATYLVTQYGRTGDWEAAVGVLNAVQQRGMECDVIFYTAVIQACARSGHPQAVLEVLDEFDNSGLQQDFVLCNVIMNACVTASGFDVASKLFKKLRRSGMSFNVVAYTSLISSGCKPQHAVEMNALLETMQQDGVIGDAQFYCAAMRAFVACGRWDRALDLWADLLNRVAEKQEQQTDKEYSELPSADRFVGWRKAELAKEGERGGRLQGGDSLDTMRGMLLRWAAEGGDDEVSRGDTSRISRQPQPAPSTTLDEGGGRRLPLKRKQSRGPLLDVAACNAALNAYAVGGQWAAAVEMVRCMQSSTPVGMGAGVILPRPDTVSLNCAIRACGSAQEWEPALMLFRELVARGKGNSSVKPDVVTFNSLIHSCALDAQQDVALSLLRLMPSWGVKPDVITYNSAMKACLSRRDFEGALQLLDELEQHSSTADSAPEDSIGEGMEAGAERPTQTRFSSPCSDASVEPGLTYSSTRSQDPDVPTSQRPAVERLNSLGRAERRGGRPVWRRTSDEVTYTTLITGCARARRWRQVVDLRRRMIGRGLTRPHQRLSSNVMEAAAELGDHNTVLWEMWQVLACDGTPDTRTVSLSFRSCSLLGRAREAMAIAAATLRSTYQQPPGEAVHTAQSLHGAAVGCEAQAAGERVAGGVEEGMSGSEQGVGVTVARRDLAAALALLERGSVSSGDATVGGSSKGDGVAWAARCCAAIQALALAVAEENKSRAGAEQYTPLVTDPSEQDLHMELMWLTGQHVLRCLQDGHGFESKQPLPPSGREAGDADVDAEGMSADDGVDGAGACDGVINPESTLDAYRGLMLCARHSQDVDALLGDAHVRGGLATAPPAVARRVFDSAVEAYARQGAADACLKLYEQQRTYNGWTPQVETVEPRTDGGVANTIFGTSGGERTVVAILWALEMVEDSRSAVHLVNEARQNGLRLERGVYDSLVRVCAASGDWRKAVDVLEEMREAAGCVPLLETYDVAVSACMSAGQMGAATKVHFMMGEDSKRR